MEQLRYVKLLPDDRDIPLLLKIHQAPEICRYIGIDREKYFDYVTHTGHVYYYKVMLGDEIAAALHVEQTDGTLYLSVLTRPEHQRKGIAAQILEDVKAKKLLAGFSEIVVSIDRENTPSIKLFEKAGFTLRGEEDNLLEYCWSG